MFFKFIAITIAVSVVAAQRPVKPNRLPQWPIDGKCTPGVKYQNDCNICICTSAGIGACTVMECVGQRSVRLAGIVPEKFVRKYPQWPGIENCIPGVIYQNDCNICECTESIYSPCTALECDGGRVKRSNDQLHLYIGKSDIRPVGAVPRKSAHHDDLVQWPGDGKCTPGVVYKNDCNTCKCTADRMGECTLKYCGESRKMRSATKSPILSSVNRFEDLPNLPLDGPCEAGRIYKFECNTCRCTSDLRHACTDMAC
ncbi:pacifastin-like protease inhibitor cvp4 [Fopius arisanus]|uniref:Pacifastin-like protease inhibitor cvp4 n=1 Tax=Fopius arisanus TaxID=64838 RepID=A0A9R1SYK8_9HYME|nr:PREDICTED: pacifastin-like protease inhibitor cvp4 [Fopius arisanus]